MKALRRAKRGREEERLLIHGPYEVISRLDKNKGFNTRLSQCTFCPSHEWQQERGG
jgi:hypothetical protein